MRRRFAGLVQDYAVGDVRALRTFRLGSDGGLYPLFSGTPWAEGPNTAICQRDTVDEDEYGELERHGHRAPADDCGCGFWAYGHLRYTSEQSAARHVLAVIAASGTLIAGTHGIRARVARIEAVRLGPRVETELAARMAARYRSVQVYRDQAAMLAEYPLTELDTYRRPWLFRTQARAAAARTVMLALMGVGFILGLLPFQAAASSLLALLTAVLLLLFLGAALAATWQRRLPLAALESGLALWMIAPGADTSTQLVMRAPFILAMSAAIYYRWLGKGAIGIRPPTRPGVRKLRTPSWVPGKHAPRS